jgi:hypothetical protein
MTNPCHLQFTSRTFFIKNDYYLQTGQTQSTAIITLDALITA